MPPVDPDWFVGAEDWQQIGCPTLKGGLAVD